MLLLAFAPACPAATANVSNVTQLVSAINDGSAGDTINIAAGTYLLTASLRPKANMTILGAGIGNTILRPAGSWTPGAAAKIDPTNWGDVNTSAYMFYLGNNNGINNVTISGLTINGLKQLHGAVCGNTINNLTVANVYFHDFTFCGIRVVGGSQLVVRDCEFINMAVSDMDPEAGAVVFAWLSNSEFYNNQFYFATHGVYYGTGVNAGNFYGFKGRQLVNSRIHHNTIMVNFSIELPFDDNSDVEIDHNYLAGWISIPKYAGGTIPTSGMSCRIHHNYDSSAVVAEYPRNAVEIDHNLLDNPRNEAGSMLSGWTIEEAPGSTKMHNNLIKNLGRVLADVGKYNNLQFYNNHVNAPDNPGATENVLFIIDSTIDRSSFVFRDNIVDCTGHPRALLWAGLGAGFTSIANNTLISVTDQANYNNPNTGAVRGPLEPLYFNCGAPGNQFLVDQWTITPATGGGSNTPPTLSTVSTQTINEDAATSALAVTVGDAETAVGSLTLTAAAADTTLLPAGGISIGGSDANRTVTLTPAAHRNGSTLITLTVNDGSTTTSSTFTLSVTPVNDPPVNTVAPNLGGAPASGVALTANSGTWNDSIDGGTTISYAYAWSRASTSGGAGATAVAATQAYTPVSGDVGAYLRVTVTATDAGTPGTASASASSAWLLVTAMADTTPPATPGTPTGSSATSATPTLSGTTEAGATVRISDGGTLLATVTANGIGQWTYTVSPALSAGTHNLTVVVVDPAGNVSAASPAWTVTVVGGTSPSAPVADSSESGGTCGAGALAVLLLALASCRVRRSGRRDPTPSQH